MRLLAVVMCSPQWPGFFTNCCQLPGQLLLKWAPTNFLESKLGCCDTDYVTHWVFSNCALLQAAVYPSLDDSIVSPSTSCLPALNFPLVLFYKNVMFINIAKIFPFHFIFLSLAVFSFPTSLRRVYLIGFFVVVFFFCFHKTQPLLLNPHISTTSVWLSHFLFNVHLWCRINNSNNLTTKRQETYCHTGYPPWLGHSNNITFCGPSRL